MDQEIIDEAVKIATRSALNGHPVQQIIWIPPISATSDPIGSFCIIPCRNLTASNTVPWDEG